MVKTLVLTALLLALSLTPGVAGREDVVEGIGSVPSDLILGKGRRVAIVIGNERYANRSHVALAVNDARTVADFLRTGGFEVIPGFDLDGRRFREMIDNAKESGIRSDAGVDDRINALTTGRHIDLLVLFFAGASVNVAGRDFLLGVDASEQVAVSSDDAISIDSLISELSSATRTRMFVFNTCHRQAMSQLPSNTVVFVPAPYGCPPDATGGINSYFVEALVQNLSVAGRPITDALDSVEKNVERKTQRRPRREGLFETDVVLLAASDDEVRRDFAAARRADTEQALEDFLARHGESRGRTVPEEVEKARDLLDRKKQVRTELSRGTSYALIVGNKEYVHFGGLANPHRDALAVAEMLTTHYGFTTTLKMPEIDDPETKKKIVRVRNLLLLDRPKLEMLSRLDDLEEALTEHDRLLIYYAGHGDWDQKTRKTYWIPVEAGRNRRSEWVYADIINDILRNMRARSILVVSDACYTGEFFRAGSPRAIPTDEQVDTVLAQKVTTRSRVLIASGGIEEVKDGGGGGHSIFARRFLEALDNPIRPIFSASELHARHLEYTVRGSKNVNQKPIYDWLREDIAQGDAKGGFRASRLVGDFVFARTHPAASSK